MNQKMETKMAKLEGGLRVVWLFKNFFTITIMIRVTRRHKNGAKTLNITTLSITTLSITTFSIMTLIIMQSIVKLIVGYAFSVIYAECYIQFLYVECHHAECRNAECRCAECCLLC